MNAHTATFDELRIYFAEALHDPELVGKHRDGSPIWKFPAAGACEPSRFETWRKARAARATSADPVAAAELAQAELEAARARTPIGPRRVASSPNASDTASNERVASKTNPRDASSSPIAALLGAVGSDLPLSRGAARVSRR